MIAPNSRNSQPSETIEFDRKRSPLVIFFLVVPALVLVMIGVTVATNRFPLPLLGLLGAVAASCLFWIKTALDEVGSVNVEMTAQDLKIKRLVSNASYSWSSIELIKLVDPGPSLSDISRSEGGRVGIGVFLRESPNRGKPDQAPDLVIITAMQESAVIIIKASERIIAFHRKAAGGKTGASAFGKSGKGFRRAAKAA